MLCVISVSSAACVLFVCLLKCVNCSHSRGTQYPHRSLVARVFSRHAAERKHGDTLMQSTSWRELYKAAMLEIDLSKMKARINAAVAAVHLRMGEVAISEGNSRAEVQEMSDALQNLQTLRKMNGRVSSRQVAPKNNSPQEGVL
jgi:hypothetical protein